MNQEKMQLNIGICDDEPRMAQQIGALCEKTLGENYALHLDISYSPGQMLAGSRPFHLALLDVQLLETSGIELAKSILEINPKCRILFVSGFLHAVSQVYEVPHFCFVLKEQLPRFLIRAAELSAKDAGRRIMLSCGRKMEELQLSDILTIERRGHVSFVKTLDGRVLQTREKLKELLLRIRDQDFIRCHASYLVNLQHVDSLEGNSFLLPSGDRVPISRPNESACRDAFFRHLGEMME